MIVCRDTLIKIYEFVDQNIDDDDDDGKGDILSRKEIVTIGILARISDMSRKGLYNWLEGIEYFKLPKMTKMYRLINKKTDDHRAAHKRSIHKEHYPSSK